MVEGPSRESEDAEDDGVIGPGKGSGSSLDNCCRKTRMLACKVESREGWDARMARAAEDVVASIAGRAAEKTDADELMR